MKLGFWAIMSIALASAGASSAAAQQTTHGCACLHNQTQAQISYRYKWGEGEWKGAWSDGAARYVALDLREPWPAAVADASLSLVICANTLHITPWACSEGLFEHAARALKPGGHLCAYGPFKVDGAFVGDDGGAGNERFDAKLRSTNGAWGLRDVSDLAALAAQRGLRLAAKIPMPANNLTLHFIKN